VERFDQRDLEVHFRELTQPCQTSNPEQYFSDFFVGVSDGLGSI